MDRGLSLAAHRICCLSRSHVPCCLLQVAVCTLCYHRMVAHLPTSPPYPQVVLSIIMVTIETWVACELWYCICELDVGACSPLRCLPLMLLHSTLWWLPMTKSGVQYASHMWSLLMVVITYQEMLCLSIAFKCIVMPHFQLGCLLVCSKYALAAIHA